MVIYENWTGPTNNETSTKAGDGFIDDGNDKALGKFHKSRERGFAGQSRRIILVKSGGALLASFAGGIASAVSSSEAGENNSPQGLQQGSAETSKPGSPSPSEFVELGGCLSLLFNLPTDARVGDVVLAVGRFLKLPIFDHLKSWNPTVHLSGNLSPLMKEFSRWMGLCCS